MARPRTFPNLADAPPRLSQMGGETYTPASLGAGIIAPKDAHRFAAQVSDLCHPVPAGYNDPLAITCVVDCLLRLEHDTTIRARDLADIMSPMYRNLIWTPAAIGRIMGELVEAASVLPTDVPPIESHDSHGGRRFAVNVTPANWTWLAEMRDRLGALAKRTIDMERATGRPEPRPSFPFDEIGQIDYTPDRVAA